MIRVSSIYVNLRHLQLHSKSEMTPISLQVFMDKNLKLPLKMLVLEPMVLCITLFTSFAYGVSYLLVSGSVPICYDPS